MRVGREDILDRGGVGLYEKDLKGGILYVLV